MITNRDAFKKGHLTARPNNNKENVLLANITSGIIPLQLAEKRDGFIYVPKNYHKDTPAAIALMLHGAGGQAQHGLDLLWQYADQKNIILVAPASREATWDIIAKDAFDADVVFINQALEFVFNHYNIDKIGRAHV